MSLKTPVQKLNKFTSDQNGSIAIMFAVVLAVVVIAGGIAIDFARSISHEADMQAAADGAVLAAVRAKSNDSSLNNGALKKIAQDYFEQNINANLNIQSFKLVPDGDAYRVEVAANSPTTLMGVTGVNAVDINVDSVAEIGPGKPIELVLVLDNTGSMSGAKLTALKSSANLLVDMILDSENTDNNTKIALVPFSEHVNVGMSNRNASWIEVPADYSETNNVCSNTYPDRVDSNCRIETQTTTTDGVTSTYEANICDTDWGEPVQVCSDQTSTYEWKGCVGSRDYPLNTNDEDYNLNKVPGLLNVWCRDPITPLTADKDIISAGIDAMNASGNTYIPAGLAWGWRAVSSANPYNEGKPHASFKDINGAKAIVLMTDGENTRSPNYPDNWGSDVTLANTLTTELCDNIKAEDIRIYTIAFEVSDATTKTMIEGCATASDHYFDADNPAELETAFSTIAGQLSQLRLTK